MNNDIYKFIDSDGDKVEFRFYHTRKWRPGPVRECLINDNYILPPHKISINRYTDGGKIYLELKNLIDGKYIVMSKFPINNNEDIHKIQENYYLCNCIKRFNYYYDPPSDIIQGIKCEDPNYILRQMGYKTDAVGDIIVGLRL